MDLHAIPSVERIRGPRLPALSFASYPAGEQIPVAGVAIHVACVEIEESVAQRATGREIGVDAFRAQIELCYFWNVRKVQPAMNRRAVHICNGRILILG